MTKTYCDVCGAAQKSVQCKVVSTKSAALDMLRAANVHDICPECLNAAEAINWPDHILALVRNNTPRVPEEGP